MPFEWFVAMRYLREGRTQTLLVLSAVSVGVSVVVFLSALISSLQTSLIDKTLGSQPHIAVRVPDEAPRPLARGDEAKKLARSVQKAPQRLRSIDQWPRRVRELEGVPGVVAVSPTVVGAAFAERGSAKKPVVVRGIEPERYLGILDVKKKLVQGRYDVAGSQVVIGAVLAKDLGVTVGEKIRVVTAEGIDDTLTISGHFEVGNKGADGAWILTSLRQAQSLYALPGGATSMPISLVFSRVSGVRRLGWAARERCPVSFHSIRLFADASAGQNWVIAAVVAVGCFVGVEAEPPDVTFANRVAITKCLDLPRISAPFDERARGKRVARGGDTSNGSGKPCGVGLHGIVCGLPS